MTPLDTLACFSSGLKPSLWICLGLSRQWNAFKAESDYINLCKMYSDKAANFNKICWVTGEDFNHKSRSFGSENRPAIFFFLCLMQAPNLNSPLSLPSGSKLRRSRETYPCIRFHAATELKHHPVLIEEPSWRSTVQKDVLSEPVSVSFIFFQALITPEIKESLCKSGDKKKVIVDSHLDNHLSKAPSALDVQKQENVWSTYVNLFKRRKSLGIVVWSDPRKNPNIFLIRRHYSWKNIFMHCLHASILRFWVNLNILYYIVSNLPN